MITRRDFLAATSASLVNVALRSDASAPAERPWYVTMRRCGQLNLNERDPLTLDVTSWIGYWASLKLDALLLNGGGIAAFYPTAVPCHHRSEFLGSRDLFGELSAATKSRNIRLVARMDCNYAYEDALEAHPEWFERNRDGSPRRHGESPWLYKTCMFSRDFTDQMAAIYREINRRYPVDGFFTNGWPSTGELTACYCENCQQVYRERVGGVPPDRADATNPQYRKYYDAYMDRVLNVWNTWQSVVTERRPDSVYVGNLGGGIRGPTRGQTWGQTRGQTGGQTRGQTWGQTRGQTWGQTRGQTWGQTRGQTWGSDPRTDLGSDPGTDLGVRPGDRLGADSGTDSSCKDQRTPYGSPHVSRDVTPCNRRRRSETVECSGGRSRDDRDPGRRRVLRG